MPDGRRCWRNLETAAVVFTDPMQPGQGAPATVGKGKVSQTMPQAPVFGPPTTPPPTSPAAVSSLEATLGLLKSKTSEAAGWTQASHKGCPYYYNMKLIITQWEPPDIIAEVRSAAFKESIAATEAGLQKLKGLAPWGLSGAKTSGAAASSMPPDNPPRTVVRNAAPGEPNLSKTVLKGKETLQKAIEEFHGFVSQRQLAAAWQTSYHITFAKEITEAMWHEAIVDMGIGVHEQQDGLPVWNQVPYAVPRKGSQSVP